MTAVGATLATFITKPALPVPLSSSLTDTVTV